jgi:hypothetical protein
MIRGERRRDPQRAGSPWEVTQVMNWWMAQQVAEEHRRDLSPPARNGMRRGAAPDDLVLMADRADQESHAAARQTPGEEMPRRAIAPSVGTLLIRMGTRLGGTSMRTS